MSAAPATLFDLLWESLADMMGTGATATLLRRAVKRAVERAPRLGEIVVQLDGLQYSYRLPDAWHKPRDDEALDDLRALVAALLPLLEEMTGPVVVARLARIGPLADAGVFERGEVA